MAAADPAAAALISWAVWSTTLPGAHTPSMLVRPVRSVATQPSSLTSQPRAVSSSSDGTKRGPTNSAVRLTIGPSASSTPRTPVSPDTIDFAIDDPHAASDQPLPLVGLQVDPVGKEHHIVGPLPDQLRLAQGERTVLPSDHPERAVAYLVAVAVRAKMHILAPPRAQARDLGELIAEP